MNPSKDELFFARKGNGPNIVFSHGTPTHSGEYARVVDQIKSQYNCILIDHLGFGSSPKPFDGDYSIEAHQKRFKNALIKNDVKSFHLVVHDFGGVIALPLLFDPDFRVLSLTLLNTWYWTITDTEPQMNRQKFLVTWGLMPFLYRYFNFSAKFLLPMAWGKHASLSKEKHSHYMKMFPTKKDRSGTIGFLRTLFDFDHSVWKNSEKLTTLSLPVQVIWGGADPLITRRNLDRWKQIFPHAKVRVLETVGHFVAEEAPEAVADSLLSFCV